jgi:hypothetical protein
MFKGDGKIKLESQMLMTMWNYLTMTQSLQTNYADVDHVFIFCLVHKEMMGTATQTQQ